MTVTSPETRAFMAGVDLAKRAFAFGSQWSVAVVGPLSWIGIDALPCRILAVSSRLNPEILFVLLCYVNGNASQSDGLGDARRDHNHGPSTTKIRCISALRHPILAVIQGRTPSVSSERLLRLSSRRD